MLKESPRDGLSEEKSPFFLHEVYIDFEKELKKESLALQGAKENFEKYNQADAYYLKSLDDLTNRVPQFTEKLQNSKANHQRIIDGISSANSVIEKIRSERLSQRSKLNEKKSKIEEITKTILMKETEFEASKKTLQDELASLDASICNRN